MEKYTRLAQGAYDKLLQNDMEPSDAIAFFVEHVPVRTFMDMLKAVYSGEDLKVRLVEGLFAFKAAFHDIYLAVNGKTPLPVRDTVRRNVSNWLDRKTVPQKRLDVIGVCFALGLRSDVADGFMRLACGYGFHMREPLEIALLYCLHNKKSIEDSATFIKTLDLSVPDEIAEAQTMTTDLVESEFWRKVRDDASLIRFLGESRASFGRMRNTALQYFRHYYAALATPEKAENEPSANKPGAYVDRFSVGKVVSERLRFGVPLADNLKGLSQYQTAIREAWLGETSVKRMLERREEVSRKALLLLYIATSGSGKTTYLTRTSIDGEVSYSVQSAAADVIDDFDDFDEWDTDDDLSPQQSLQEHTTHLDLILTDCGFARLDPRTPFDWLVLYSLCVDETDYYDEAQHHEFGLMSERLEGVMKLLFAEMGGNDLHDDLP